MSDARFCSQCGAALGADARFCSQCGTAVAGASAAAPTPVAAPGRPNLREIFMQFRSGEQRTATILMADITGFTALGEQADPEWLYNLINEVFEELVECLVAHGAHIDKYMGDEVMALFGVPIAQERSVERALRAALALRERMAELNRAGRFGGLRLGLHIGVNVGPVMVGPVGHRDHADYTVIGDAVNVTKRLTDAAPLDEIYVTRAVRDAAAGLFSFEALGPSAVQGRQQRVEVYRLVQAVERPPSALRPDAVPLLGRESELAALSQVAERVLQGEAQTVQVRGPAGIGKSRLIQEWCASPQGARFRVVQTACHAFGQHFPLLPLMEIVAQLLDLHLEGWPPRVSGEVRAAVAASGVEERAVAFLTSLLETFSREGAQADEAWRRSLAGAVCALLQVSCAARPLCVVLEDTQWLDEATTAVLSELPPMPEGCPLLFVTSSREMTGDEQPWGTPSRVVTLTELPREVMGRIVLAWARPAILPQSTVDAICDRAEGHPYFARELVHALRRGSADGAASTDLPHTLQELFLAELDWLPSGLRRLVQASSVLGEPVSPLLLWAAMSEHATPQPELLAEAVGADLLREGRSPDQFVFGRRLLFEAAYTTIPPMRRRGLHARIAGHLLAQLPVLGETAVHAAAHHAYLGYGDERALDLLVRSARRYHLQYALRQAIRDATRALAVIGALADPASARDQRLEALWVLAQSCAVMGELERAEGALAEAEGLVDEGTNEDIIGRMALTAATLQLMRGEPLQAERQYQQAARVWERLGNPTRVAHSWLGIGMCAVMVGDLERGFDQFRRAATLDGAELWVRGAALNNAGAVLLARGHYGEAESYLRKGLGAHGEVEDRRGVAHSKASLGELCYRLNRPEEAAHWLQQAIDEAGGIEDASCCSLARAYLTRVNVLQGNLQEASRCLQEAGEEAVCDPDHRALLSLARYEVALTQGAKCEEGAEPLSAEKEWEPCCEVPAEGAPPSGTCLNARAEWACLTAEAALSGRDGNTCRQIAGRLREALAAAPDRHLRRYGGWLLGLVEQTGVVATGPDPALDGEWTVFDERARRLKESLRDAGP